MSPPCVEFWKNSTDILRFFNRLCRKNNISRTIIVVIITPFNILSPDKSWYYSYLMIR